MKPITTRDVAEHCGIPHHDVARVLRAVADTGEEKARTILRAAREMGYPLNEKSAGRALNLGVLFAEESNTGLTHPFFASLLNGFKAEAEARGYDITFINHNIGTQGASYYEHCRYRRVDGAMLACVDFDSPEIQELLRSDVPCVAVDYEAPGQLSVISDNVSGVTQLVDYAVSQGHRRIAFLHGQSNSRVTRDRVESFRAAMEKHHLPIPAGYLVEGRYGEIEAVRPFVRDMLALPERPTCILLPDDATYLVAQETIREEELRIPADISVAGYDGIALTQSLRPRLTTIRQDSDRMGREAAQLLIDRIENGTPVGPPMVVPVELIAGDTVSWCNAW